MTPDLLFEYIVAVGVGIIVVIFIVILVYSMFFND